MSRPAAPSMPTEKQIRDLYEVVSTLSPGAKISRIGPDGVTFNYRVNEDDDSGGSGSGGFPDRPFSARGKNG